MPSAMPGGPSLRGRRRRVGLHVDPGVDHHDAVGRQRAPPPAQRRCRTRRPGSWPRSTDCAGSRRAGGRAGAGRGGGRPVPGSGGSPRRRRAGRGSGRRRRRRAGGHGCPGPLPAPGTTWSRGPGCGAGCCRRRSSTSATPCHSSRKSPARHVDQVDAVTPFGEGPARGQLVPLHPAPRPELVGHGQDAHGTPVRSPAVSRRGPTGAVRRTTGRPTGRPGGRSGATGAGRSRGGDGPGPPRRARTAR